MAARGRAGLSAAFSASTVGAALGAPQRYYRAGTPLLHTSSEGPAWLSLTLFTATRPRRDLLSREGYATPRCSSRHVKQASASLVGRRQLRLG
jgi:hypothetical protein